MPHFVTLVFSNSDARPATPARAAPTDGSRLDPDGYRRRLAGLRTRAPDTLRARVRRELREATASTARSE